MSLPVKVYSDLLESLYATTLDESRWQTFLVDLCSATQSIIAFLVRNDNAMGSRMLASGGSPAPEGVEDYDTTNPVRVAFMRRPRTGVVEVEDFLPHSQLIATDYYSLMAASGVSYGTCVVPTLSMRRYDLISVWRGSDRPRLEPDLTELLNLLLPHIQNTLRIQQALGVFQDRAQIADAILDASTTASFLLSASGRLLYMNKAGATLCSDRDGVMERNGHLVPARPERRTEWAAQVSAASSSRRHPGGALMLARSGKSPLQVLVSPFRADTSKRTGRVLVLATEPDRPMQFPDTVLRQLYGLTAAETEVANGLLTGFAPEAIATIRGVSVGTVRTQIKSLFLKTSTRRQSDLLRLLHTLPQANGAAD